MKKIYFIILILVIGIIILMNQEGRNQSPEEEMGLTSNDNAEPELPMERAKERVTKKPFGIKISPENSPISPERFSGYHTGIDYEIFEGEENIDVRVFAVCSGKLFRKENVSGYGGLLIQKCKLENQPVTILYGHIQLDSAQQQVGDNIAQGDFLALLGKTHSEDTDGERKHLHLGVHKGIIIDIRGYVQNESELKDWINYEKSYTNTF